MLHLLKSDITKMNTDAIVNAANTSLMGGGGVDGAIHRAGGPEILDDCRKIIQRQGSCKTGDAVITGAGKLPCRYVIHTVGPVWNGGVKNEENLLVSAYRKSLELAAKHSLKSIAFPNISTGIYHFPKQAAAELAIKTVKEFMENPGTLKDVYFVCFDDENYEIYQSLMK